MFPRVEEDTKRKQNKERLVHGMILNENYNFNVIETVMCLKRKKYFTNWKMFCLERNLIIFFSLKNLGFIFFI